MESVFSVLRRIERASGRNAKIRILRDNLSNSLLLSYLQLCWDYDVVFGINPQKPDPVSPEPPRISDDDYLSICLTAARQLADDVFGRNTHRAQQVSINLELLGTKEQSYWWRRLLHQDPKIGLTSRTLNQLQPGAASKFYIRRCGKFRGKLRSDRRYVLEPKFDGWRIFFFKEGKVCTAYSSKGRVLGRAERDHHWNWKEISGGCGHLCVSVHKILGESDLVLDGEVVGTLHREEAAAASSKNPDKTLRAWIFDCVDVGRWQSNFDVEQKYRRIALEEVFVPGSAADQITVDMMEMEVEGEDGNRWLRSILKSLALRRGIGRSGEARGEQLPPPGKMSFTDEPVMIAPQIPCRDVTHAVSFAKEMIALGYEGAIVKDNSSPYELRRTDDWLKLKSEIDQEFKIKRIVWRNKEPAIIVDLGNGQEASVGNLSDKEIREVWLPPELLERLCSASEKSLDLEPGDLLAQWVPGPDGRPNPEVIGKWATIRFQHWTRAGAIVHPRFIRFRGEKSGGEN